MHRRRLTDARKIAAAAAKILADNPVARLFTTDIADGQFRYDYNHDAFAYEELLAGRWVLTTSLTRHEASPAKVLTAYRHLLAVEHRFSVLKHTLDLRPIYHWTETRVRGHVAVCMLAALIETLIEADLTTAAVADPDLDGQVLSTERALRELERIRQVTLTAGDHHIDVVTRLKPLQAAICAACHIDTTPWQHSHIH